MKKAVALVLLILMLGLAACGQAETSATTADSSEVGMANPWRVVTEEEAKGLCPRSFNVPEGAENVVWSVMDSAADSSGVPGALVQVSFDLNGNSFTAREQVTGDNEEYQHGMYYDWTNQRDENMQGWLEGMTCHSYRYIGEDEYADLCTWYDVEVGISYSLSVAAKDLDGFDLLAVADAMTWVTP